jgi:hypothetical protein
MQRERSGARERVSLGERPARDRNRERERTQRRPEFQWVFAGGPIPVAVVRVSQENQWNP